MKQVQASWVCCDVIQPLFQPEAHNDRGSPSASNVRKYLPGEHPNSSNRKQLCSICSKAIRAGTLPIICQTCYQQHHRSCISAKRNSDLSNWSCPKCRAISISISINDDQPPTTALYAPNAKTASGSEPEENIAARALAFST